MQAEPSALAATARRADAAKRRSKGGRRGTAASTHTRTRTLMVACRGQSSRDASWRACGTEGRRGHPSRRRACDAGAGEAVGEVVSQWAMFFCCEFCEARWEGRGESRDSAPTCPAQTSPNSTHRARNSTFCSPARLSVRSPSRAAINCTPPPANCTLPPSPLTTCTTCPPCSAALA